MHSGQYGAFTNRRKDEDFDDAVKQPRRSLMTFQCFSIVSLSVFVSFVVWVALMKKDASSFLPSYLTTAQSGISTLSQKNESLLLSFTLYRENYEPLPYFHPQNTVSYHFLRDFQAVIEPYRTMKLHIYPYTTTSTSGDQKAPSSSVSSPSINWSGIEYEVCTSSSGIDGLPVATSSSSPLSSEQQCQSSHGGVKDTGIQLNCSVYTLYDITIYHSSTTAILGQGKAICLYVRREMRSLTKVDQQGYLQAMSFLYTTNLSHTEGKQQYGSNFWTAEYFHRIHYFNSVQQDGDHIHEGNGFLLQHVKLTSMFDLAVLSVDPRESLPYWDFTIDAAEQDEGRIYALQADTYGESKLVTDATLGYTYTSHPLIDGRILNGYWMNITMNKSPFPATTIPTAFGYMRSPWNMNPSPYVSRFWSTLANQSLPFCETHYTVLQFTEMMSFFYTIANGPHGSAHSLVGGVYGCDELLFLREKGYIEDTNQAFAELCLQWDIRMKELYRANLIQPSTNCSLPSTTTTGDIQDAFCPYNCTDSSMIMSRLRTLFTSAKSDVDEDVLNDDVTAFICGGRASRIFLGDIVQSSSTVDPYFWSIHPIIERLLHMKLSVGGFLDSKSWAKNVSEEFVCDKAYCYDASQDGYGYHDSCCYGHYAEDRMYDGYLGSRDHYLGLTNAEMLQQSDPRSLSTYRLSYIYDSFAYSNCTGHDFVTLLEDLQRVSQEQQQAATNAEDRAERKKK